MICSICGKINSDIYMLSEYAWYNKLGMERRDTICLGCLYSSIIDKTLTIDDFTNVPANNNIKIGYMLSDLSYKPNIIEECETMNKINFNKDRNEVDVYGCVTCPFLHYYERGADYDPYCSLNQKINTDPPSEKFPVNCPLIEPNFKLTRNIYD